MGGVGVTTRYRHSENAFAGFEKDRTPSELPHEQTQVHNSR